MAKKQRDYEEIYGILFDVYELSSGTDKTEECNVKSNIRSRLNKTDEYNVKSNIRRRVNQIFGEQAWENISQIEKDHFIYIDMKKYLMNFVTEENKDRIEKKIANNLKAPKIVQSMIDHNNSVSLEPYFNKGDSEEKKRKAFEHYKEDYSIYNNKKDPDITYEEWSQRPSIRPYDLYQQAVLESYEETEQENSINYPIRDAAFTESEINRYTINTICDVLQKKLGITIDVESIRDCVTYIHDYDLVHDSADSFQLEYDPKSSIGKKEQEKIINADRKYATCRYRLDHLDFWSEEKSDSKSNKKSGSPQ